MQEKLSKNLQIFAVNFATKKFELLSLIAMTLKFTQKGDQFYSH